MNAAPLPPADQAIVSRTKPAQTGHAAPPQRPLALYRHLLTLLKEQWKRYRKRLKRCRKDGSEVAVHDLRVEIRRLLSTLELSGLFVSARRQEKLRRLLKNHLDWFGALRDTQVQLLLLARLRGHSRAGRLLSRHLSEQEQQCLRKAARRLRRFKPSRIRKSLERLRRQIKARRDRGLQSRDVAAVRRALQQAFLKVVKLRRKVNPARSQTIHRTRVAYKKYRYMIEALQPLLGVSKAQLQAMRDYQVLMGNIQDLEVFLAGWAQLAGHPAQTPAASQALRLALEQRRQSAIRAYLEAAGRLQQFAPARGWLLELPRKTSSSPSP